MQFVFFYNWPRRELGVSLLFRGYLVSLKRKDILNDWPIFFHLLCRCWLEPRHQSDYLNRFLAFILKGHARGMHWKKMFCNTFSKVCLLCKIVLNSSVLLSKHNVWEGIYMQHIVLEKQKEKQYFYVFRKFLLRDGWWLLLLWHISCWLGTLHFIFQLYW